jgi:NAD(P)-dependent dehydrogenase (short-subunit alcohol dehydrogenase family)
MQSLTGKIAIVTGAGRGIGAASALRLARSGAVTIAVSRTQTELDETVQAAQSFDGKLYAFRADVSQEKDVLELFKFVKSKYGNCTVLVNAAGVYRGGPIEEMSVHDWDEVMAVNLRGTFLCSREALKHMRSSGGGSIINFSSLGGLRGTEKFVGTGAYVTSKFGVVGLTEVLAVETRKANVRVNCIAPGAVETRMLKLAAPQLKTETLPNDIAKLVEFLADDLQSKTLNGSVLEVHSNL